MVYNRTNRESVLELPADVSALRCPLLTLCNDSGSIGLGALHFSQNHLHLLMNGLNDLYHGDVRDIKGASNDCRNILPQVFLKTSYVWGFNYRPFGGGGSNEDF